MSAVTAVESALLAQAGFKRTATSHTDVTWERWEDDAGAVIVMWHVTATVYAPGGMATSFGMPVHPFNQRVQLALAHVKREREANPQLWGAHKQ